MSADELTISAPNEDAMVALGGELAAASSPPLVMVCPPGRF